MHRWLSVWVAVLGLAEIGNAHHLAAQVFDETAAIFPERTRSLIQRNEIAKIVAVLALSVAMDNDAREDVQEHRSSLTNGVARVGNAFGDPRYLVPALGAGWLVIRATGMRKGEQAVLRAGEAGLLASGITGIIKFGIGRVRPLDGSDMDRFRPFSGHSAFPSGHTAMAFTVATALARSTPDHWSDVAFYGLASLTAVSRLNDDYHWTSDVVAGALVGHLIGRYVVPGHTDGGRPHDARVTASPGGIGVTLDF